jgi:hypothetical protein
MWAHLGSCRHWWIGNGTAFVTAQVRASSAWQPWKTIVKITMLRRVGSRGQAVLLPTITQLAEYPVRFFTFNHATHAGAMPEMQEPFVEDDMYTNKSSSEQLARERRLREMETAHRVPQTDDRLNRLRNLDIPSVRELAERRASNGEAGCSSSGNDEARQRGQDGFGWKRMVQTLREAQGLVRPDQILTDAYGCVNPFPNTSHSINQTRGLTETSNPRRTSFAISMAFHCCHVSHIASIKTIGMFLVTKGP